MVDIRVGFFESIGWLPMACYFVLEQGFEYSVVFWIWLWFGNEYQSLFEMPFAL